MGAVRDADLLREVALEAAANDDPWVVSAWIAMRTRQSQQQSSKHLASLHKRGHLQRKRVPGGGGGWVWAYALPAEPATHQSVEGTPVRGANPDDIARQARRHARRAAPIETGGLDGPGSL